MNKTRQQIITIGHAEGVSFLVLLFIAMPLKYLANMPLAVRVVGGIHGFLFVAFVAILILAYFKINLPLIAIAKAFILSFIPFGTFFIDRVLPQAK